MAGRVLFRWSDGSEFCAYEPTVYDPIRHEFIGRNPQPIPYAWNRVRSFGGYRDDNDPRNVIGELRRRGSLKTLIAIQDENRNRQSRVAPYSVARQALNQNRQLRRQSMAEFATVKTPFLALRDDVKAGRIARSSEIVAEPIRIDLGDRHYAHYTNEALGYMVQLERLTQDYASQRRITESVMRHSKGGGYSAKASTAWRKSRGTTTLYLTQDALQRATDNANSEVSVFAENAKGVQCVSYTRNRGWRVEAIVKRHMRDWGNA
jgi:hypothetical protein